DLLLGLIHCLLPLPTRLPDVTCVRFSHPRMANDNTTCTLLAITFELEHDHEFPQQVDSFQARPPFTVMVCLVIMRLSSAPRNNARWAMAAGWMPSRRNWLRPTSSISSCVGYHSRCCFSERTSPGAMALTRMRCLPTSRASEWVKPTIAALADA